MIGKILTISDAGGQVYVDNGREAWRKQDFILINGNIKDVLKEADFSNYYMIALCMTIENSEVYRNYVKLLRSNTDIPIVLFPIEEAKANAMPSLHEGADQVISIPSDMDLAIVNCLALIRRHINSKAALSRPVTMYADYKIFLDVGRYTANVDGKEIELHKKEFDILRFLMEHRGNILTYSQIFSEVWGFEYYDSSNNLLWSQVKNLRKKLQWKPDLPEYIKNKRGVGYKFSPL